MGLGPRQCPCSDRNWRGSWDLRTLSTPFRRPGRGAAAAAARTAPSAAKRRSPSPLEEQGQVLRGGRRGQRHSGSRTWDKPPGHPQGLGVGREPHPARAHQQGKMRAAWRVLPGLGEASPRETSRWISAPCPLPRVTSEPPGRYALEPQGGRIPGLVTSSRLEGPGLSPPPPP